MTAKPLEKTLSQATLESSQNAQSVESLESTFSKADSMDCHATAAAVSRNDSKATTAKSTTKKLVLSISLVLAAALELSANRCDFADGHWANDLSWMTIDACYTDKQWGDSLYSYYISTDTQSPSNLDNIHENRGDLTINVRSQISNDSPSQHPWFNLNLKNGGSLKNLTIREQVKIELKGFSGNENNSHTVHSITHRATRLNLRVDNGTNGESSSNTLTINTLNQDNGNISNGSSSTNSGDTQIFKGATVNNFNLQSGKAYQFTLTINTLNQDNGNISNGSSSTNSGDTQIFKGATVNNFNLQSGKAYQFDGTVGNLNITGGEYYQGIMDNNNVVPDTNSSNANNIGTGGTIKNLILAGGTFKYYKGQVENITLVAPQAAQAATQASVSTTQSGEQSNQGSDSSTPPSLFGKGSPNGNSSTPTNAYSGLIQSVTQKDGKNTATLSNGTTIEATLTNSDQNNRTKGLTINNKTGDLTNSGNLTELNITQSSSGTTQAYSTQESKSITNTAGASITTLTLFDGYTTINNYGTITTITHNQSGTQARAAQTLAALTTPIIINNGKGGYISEYEVKDNAQINNSGRIGTLTLKESSNTINNDAKNGGIIENLIMTGGTNSINTLDGVAYNANNGMSTLDLQGGTLAVDTLSVGLNGNVAKHRIDLSSSSGTKNGTLSVKNIEVAYVDGNFNPTQHINTDLKDYVSSGTTVTNQLDTKSPTTFRSSEQLQNLGITFNADGTPLFKVEDSIAADMTSLLIRQSMRRKMLIDTYLAEQSRRSLKNKERRTKQRIEANVLAQSKEQYEKDLAAYKQDKAKWDKLASSKENKALIAQYEKEYKAYEKAFKQYEKDKAKWEKLSDKDKAKLADKSKAPIAPIEPKAPTKPTAKEGDKDYKQVMADFDKAQKEHKKALSQYQKALKQYEKDKAKWEKLSDKDKAKLAKSGKQAPIAPKEPTQPAILAQEPIMPIAPELHSSLESLYADANGVKGDFFDCSNLCRYAIFCKTRQYQYRCFNETRLSSLSKQRQVHTFPISWSGI